MLEILPTECLVILLLPYAFGHILPHPGCDQNPANFASVIEEFQSSILNDRSLINLPGVNHGYPIAPDNSSDFVHIVRVNFTEFKSCPSRPNGTVPDLNVRSTCPVHWVINSDANRIPRKIAEAECSCENCLEFAPDGRRTRNVCEPVYYLIDVLRRVGCDGQFYRYARVVEKIKIACTCAHPYVQVSGGRNRSGPTPSP